METKYILGQFPWNVFLDVNKGDNEGACEGVLIDASHILTAAKCFLNVDKDKSGSASAGIVTEEEDCSLQKKKVLDVKIHKDVNGARETRGNGITITAMNLGETDFVFEFKIVI
jgi:V8-like Glu-specific endopeptidase